MKSHNKQSGFSVFELVFLVVIVAVVALIGYGVYSRHQTKVDNNNNPVVSSQATPANVSSAPTINSTNDLTNAEKVLDQNDPTAANTTDSTNLDAQTNGF